MDKSKLSAILLAGGLLAACGGPANTGNSAANATPAANANSNMFTVTTPTPDQVQNDAPTLTPVFQAYCAAMAKKDEAALRRLFSRGTLQSYESQMQASGEKTLVQFLADEKVSEKLCQVRNERIAGDRAVAKVYTEGSPNGQAILFMREDGQWKLTNEDPRKLELPQ